MSTLEKFTADVSAIGNAISMRDAEIRYLQGELERYELAMLNVLEALLKRDDSNQRLANVLDEAMYGLGRSDGM